MRLTWCALALAILLAGWMPAAHAQDQNPEPWYTEFGKRVFTGSNVPALDSGDLPHALQGLSISGFVSNTSGIWANPVALRNFGRAAGEHHPANSLAMERNWTQIDLNWTIDANNKLFVRFWGVYEPPYPWEAHNLEVPAEPTIAISRVSTIATTSATRSGKILPAG